MQHELEVNAWVWPNGDSFVVQIIAVETTTGLSATRDPHTTVTILDAGGAPDGILYENLASAVARASARARSGPADAATTDIRIDSDEFVVQAPTHDSAVELALDRFDRDHSSTSASFTSELLAV